jgi:hypothetical protein
MKKNKLDLKLILIMILIKDLNHNQNIDMK